MISLTGNPRQFLAMQHEWNLLQRSVRHCRLGAKNVWNPRSTRYHNRNSKSTFLQYRARNFTDKSFGLPWASLFSADTMITGLLHVNNSKITIQVSITVSNMPRPDTNSLLKKASTCWESCGTLPQIFLSTKTASRATARSKRFRRTSCTQNILHALHDRKNKRSCSLPRIFGHSTQRDFKPSKVPSKVPHLTDTRRYLSDGWWKDNRIAFFVFNFRNCIANIGQKIKYLIKNLPYKKHIFNPCG